MNLRGTPLSKIRGSTPRGNRLVVLYMDKTVKVLYYTTKWYNRRLDLSGHFNMAVILKKGWSVQTVFTK